MKAIGGQLFAAGKGSAAEPMPVYERVVAKELGLKESWFRDAIFHTPELVIAPCRAAGRVEPDEVWSSWAIEANFGSGPVDVLLVSSYGRIGLVETKLSYNPQGRREVVAQLLDYALALQGSSRDDLPDFPRSLDPPDEIDLADALAAGKFLLIIAGDALDPRALRLSQSMLARHLTSEWDLALIDLNVYRGESGAPLLIVPELLGTVHAEIRQVVRVVVEGESPKARVQVEHFTSGVASKERPRNIASIDAFMADVKKKSPLISEEVGRVVAAFSSEVSDRIRLGMKVSTVNLYWSAPSGSQRRFLSINSEGRVRVPLDYIESEGAVELASRLQNLASPLFNARAASQSVEKKVDGANVDDMIAFVRSACEAVRMHRSS